MVGETTLTQIEVEFYPKKELKSFNGQIPDAVKRNTLTLKPYAPQFKVKLDVQ